MLGKKISLEERIVVRYVGASIPDPIYFREEGR
jgi:hypothetical protein